MASPGLCPSHSSGPGPGGRPQPGSDPSAAQRWRAGLRAAPTSPPPSGCRNKHGIRTQTHPSPPVLTRPHLSPPMPTCPHLFPLGGESSPPECGAGADVSLPDGPLAGQPGEAVQQLQLRRRSRDPNDAEMPLLRDTGQRLTQLFTTGWMS